MPDPSLITVLQNINAARSGGVPNLALLKEHALNKPVMSYLDDVDNRLVVYGSLAPGEVNHHELEALNGSWEPAGVRGYLAARGWGEHVGFPGFTWDQTADLIKAQIFTSRDLPAHWSSLDEFEGADYRRILVPAETSHGVIVANIYEVVPQAGADRGS